MVLFGASKFPSPVPTEFTTFPKPLPTEPTTLPNPPTRPPTRFGVAVVVLVGFGLVVVLVVVEVFVVGDTVGFSVVLGGAKETETRNFEVEKL